MTNPPVSPTTPAPQTLEALRSEIVSILYTNWRGETAVRTVVPGLSEQRRVLLEHPFWFGESDWHKGADGKPKPQWFLRATEANSSAVDHRDFALSGIKAWGQEAVDALTTPSTAPGRLDREAVARDLEELDNLTWKVRTELAALDENPRDPKFKVACHNTADAECLRSAYSANEDAAEAVRRIQEAIKGTQPAKLPSREAIALIIDPIAFSKDANSNDTLAWVGLKYRRDAARSRADQILALTQPSRPSNAPLASLSQMVAEKRVEAREAAALASSPVQSCETEALADTIRLKSEEPHFATFSAELRGNLTEAGHLLAFKVRPTGTDSLWVRLSSGREIIVGEYEWTPAAPDAVSGAEVPTPPHAPRYMHSPDIWRIGWAAGYLAALAASPPQPGAVAGGWQPISSAPRDGTIILISHENWGSVHAAFWGLAPEAMSNVASKRHPWVFLDSTNEENNAYEDGENGPSVWQSLPTAPARGVGG